MGRSALAGWLVVVGWVGGCANSGTGGDAPDGSVAMTPSQFDREQLRLRCELSARCDTEPATRIYASAAGCWGMFDRLHLLGGASPTEYDRDFSLDTARADACLAGLREAACGDHGYEDSCAMALEVRRTAAPLARGVACAVGEVPCDAGLYCETATGGASCGTCAPVKAAGEACSSVGACAAGLACDQGVCTAPVAEGGSCAHGYTCAAALACIEGTCARPAAEGGACANDGDCAADLFCADHRCTSVTTATAGAACVDGSQCPGSMECVGAGGSGRCVALVGVGAACDSAPCLHDLACVAGPSGQRACAELLPNGATCNRDGAGCQHVCTFAHAEDATGTCREITALPEAGEPCALLAVPPPFAPMSPGELLAKCAAGSYASATAASCTCVALGPEGTACDDGSTCLGGTCDGSTHRCAPVVEVPVNSCG